MWRFLFALAALLAVKYGAFAFEMNYSFVVAWAAANEVGIQITPTLVAFAASVIVAVVFSAKWPMLIPAFVVSSASELVMLFRYPMDHFSTVTQAFWYINVMISVVASMFLLDRRSLWHVSQTWRTVAKLVMPAALVLINLGLYRLYDMNDLGGFAFLGLFSAFMLVLITGIDIVGWNNSIGAKHQKREDDQQIADLTAEVERLKKLVSEEDREPRAVVELLEAA